VRTYLDENGSRGRTAKRLTVHENTVAYRLRQAEELVGRSVEKRTLELRLALTLADIVDASN
jgi:DNA-binding PucR family transcriptional regulator